MRSVCMRSARSVRWPISAGDMQRSRLTRQAMRSGSIAPVPELQVEQRPEQLLVVLPPCEVLVEHAAQRARLVVGARGRARPLQVVEQEFAHPATKPLV